MPAYPRGVIVSSAEVGVYHCITRCVRRAFLCGVDPITDQDFDHRKEWVRERLLERLGVHGDGWIETVRRYGRWFTQVAGCRDSLKTWAERLGRRWLQGQHAAAVAFR